MTGIKAHILLAVILFSLFVGLSWVTSANQPAQPDGIVHFSIAKITEQDLVDIGFPSANSISSQTTMTPTIYLPLVDYSDVPSPDWLTYLNSFRESSGLIHLVENEKWSQGGFLHSRYMVKNDYVGHTEDPANPWYTAEGALAASKSNVFVSSWQDTTDRRAIDFWMTAPFHAIAILDPQLDATGYGSYRESIGLWEMGATLDVARGLGNLPPGTQFPITYPTDGGNTRLINYSGGEFPDPLASCPGYSPPTGPPIMLEIGPGNLVPAVTAVKLTQDGTPIELCHFDETNYSHPDNNTQNAGRLILGNRDAIVIMPRQPLLPASSYTVQVNSNGTLYEWNFTVLATAHSLDPIPGELLQIEPAGG